MPPRMFPRPMALWTLALACAGLAAIPLGPARGQAAIALDQAEAAGRPPLAPGQPVPLRLSRGDSAYFRLPEGLGDLIARTRALDDGTDTVMALLDAQGRVLDEDDDGGEENLASRLEIGGDQRGPLFLRVGLLEQGGGRFELILEQAPPPQPGAPPRTLAEAVGHPALAVGEALSLSLRPRQEAYLRLPADGQDLVALTRRLAEGADTVLALLDANGRVVAEDDDSGEEDLASRLEVPGAQRRPLFLRVGTLGGGGAFELVLLPDAAPAAAAFPRSVREAAAHPPLEVGQSLPLALRRGQVAVFRLPEGDIAVVTRNLGRGTDTILALLDSEGNAVAEDDDGGNGLASRLEVAASDRRPLFVRAGSLGDAPAQFELAIEADSRAAPAFPTSLRAAAAAAALQPGAATEIRLRRGQSAYFLLPPGAHVALTRSLGDGTDTVLELLDENGNAIAEDDDGGGGLASRIEVADGAKGRLFLRAGVLGDGPGAFELVLLPPGAR